MKNSILTLQVILFAFMATSVFSQDFERAPQNITDTYEAEQAAYLPYNDGKLLKVPEEMHDHILAKDSKVGINAKELKDKENGCGNISFDPIEVGLCAPTGSFVVNYTGFTPEARKAFQYAVDIWSRVLNLSVPVVIDADFSALGPNVLGAAGPTFINRDGAGYPLAGHWYPIALSNQFDGTDVLVPFFGPNTAHIGASFSSEFDNWYYGLDGCPAADEFDFVTVVLHEIGHGLGFTTGRDVFNIPGLPSIGCFGQGGFPFAYDSFLENSAFPGFNLSAFAAAVGTGCFIGLGDFYTNDMLFFNGPETVACIGGPAKLYAPATFAGGSSTAHFDEATYPGVNDLGGLMTPFIGRGEATHDPGCTLALLRDLGYDAAQDVPLCEVVPTMGEWGLMSLGLLLLIIGVVTIKSRQIMTA